MTLKPGVRKRRAYGLGHKAETLALLFLVAKGYRPLARRYTGAGGEIDLIVVRGETVAFVEVKARSTLEAARHSITPLKVKRVGQAARAWLSRNGWAAPYTLRADALFIAPWRWPEHVPNAFDLNFF